MAFREPKVQARDAGHLGYSSKLRIEKGKSAFTQGSQIRTLSKNAINSATHFLYHQRLLIVQPELTRRHEVEQRPPSATLKLRRPGTRKMWHFSSGRVPPKIKGREKRAQACRCHVITTRNWGRPISGWVCGGVRSLELWRNPGWGWMRGAQLQSLC